MNAKKILAVILSIVMVCGIASCGKKNDDTKTPDDTNNKIEETINEVENKEEDKPLSDKNDKAEDKTPELKPEKTPEKEEENEQIEKPEEKPEQTPAEKPEEKPQPQTVGQKLLADFKSKAGSASDALSLAETLSANPVFTFSCMAMPVEPGFLAGFGNAEIKGFKEGAMFGPVIGSIPFIGYVFTLDDSTGTSSFISILKSNADLRWNICVAAEEMVAGSAGNKVFFVMSPKDLNAE